MIASFWKFSRPHTIIGTSLSVLALYFIALSSTNTPISLINLQLNLQLNLEDLLAVWIACLCGNVYIVGLNQLTDVEIDRINKPDLPLASGALTIKQGWLIVALMGILAIAIALISGVWLLATVGVSLIIGTAYSLPPIRLKQFPFLAAFCILTVRGVVVNLGLFLHFSRQFQGQEFINRDVWLLSLFILLFTIAIAIFKDVPDLEGDRKYEIATFSLILGKTKVFQFTCGIVAFCYLGMIAVGVIGLEGINSVFFLSYHLILLAFFWWRSSNVNLNEKSAIASFYQFIWQLFFLEYLLFPLACLI
jgi:homogentisate phytyltransferase / homogentisate geranylgeranyltransferase